MLYVAYGSNINKEQMQYRVPGAKPYGKGIIQNWKLDFHGTDGSAYATIVQASGYQVPVVLWEMSDEQEKIMDVYEGYPNAYFKKKIAVYCNGEKKFGMVYIMNESRPVARPSRKYVNTIRQGYISFGIDTAFLMDALARNSEEFYLDDVLEVRDFKAFKANAVKSYLDGAAKKKSKKKNADRDVVFIPTKKNKSNQQKPFYLRKTGSGVTYWGDRRETPQEYTKRMQEVDPFGDYPKW